MLTFVPEMELNTIIEGALYAIHWDEEDHDSLDQMAIDLTDISYLQDYFNINQEKLKYYRNPSYTPEEAVIRTAKEANELIQELRKNAILSTQGKSPDLDYLFERLHTNDAPSNARFYTDFKAKGFPGTAPWIRVYAVKCDDNLYVITGYGIKLVRDMRHDSDLRQELTKLGLATRYLDEIQMICP